jgi:peptidoglycan/xylan/chitin deacetylase (PgdA/CDA1 family)
MSQARIPILMYHQIDVSPPKGTPLRGLVVSPRTFSRHMWLMHFLGYQGLSMGKLMPYLKGERTGKVFGITFDDGYENNFHNALPVLRRLRFSSTCYAVASRVGQTNIWDRDEGIGQVSLMDEAQLQAWIDAGQEIGSHTSHHVDLTACDHQSLESEIVGSRRFLETFLRQPGGVQHFCYPYGRFNTDALSYAAEAAYVSATTTRRGRAQVPVQNGALTLPRVLVSRSTTWVQLLLKCFTNYEDRRGSQG